uniref:UDP-D-xylose:beta-D-glucoside alpha-1,3-D-xylosyltransferase n=1 Tax=Rhipicephalus pulchellus TaxID=72859 RepID=L7M2I9_RHIPC
MAGQRTVHFVRCLFVIFLLIAVCLLKYQYNNVWTNAPVDFPKAKKSQTAAQSQPQPSATTVTGEASTERVKLVVVTCKALLNMTLTNIKSAVAFTTAPLDLLLFADDENREPLQQAISSWPKSVLKRVSYEVSPVKFPEPDAKKWQTLFKPCATQRLFLPSMLPDVDAVIYVDADVLFLSPIEELWKHFTAMNSSHLAALAPESEDYATNWYRRFARHPFYQPLGVNSGVMLMNLTRMREFGWEKRLGPLLRKYGSNISWGDQDLLNILFHDHPERLLLFSCRWNYRTDHCMYGAYCTAGPPAVIHGSRRAFISDSEPAFRGLHQAMEQYELGDSLEYSFVVPFKDGLGRSRKTRCGQEFLKQVVYWEAAARSVDIAATKSTQRRES